MKKLTKKLVVFFSLVMIMTVAVACGGSSTGTTAAGGSSDSGKTDAITGTWKQTDEVNGNWTWTFSDGSKAKLVGETVGFESEGTYTLDETNKKVTVTLASWDKPKEYTYKLDGTTLDLDETYTSYHLIKQ